MDKTKSFGGTSKKEDKSEAVELILCLTLGWLGAHQFYKGNYFTGMLYMITGGYVGIGSFLDAIEMVIKMIKRK